jgi:hypothetical protein
MPHQKPLKIIPKFFPICFQVMYEKAINLKKWLFKNSKFLNYYYNFFEIYIIITIIK